MLVFWWQGRGYQTILIWLVTLTGFGLIAAIAKPLIPDRPWYWGLAFLASAAVNWRVGTRLNKRAIQKRDPQTLLKRLFYRGGHRFMSMPMVSSSRFRANSLDRFKDACHPVPNGSSERRSISHAGAASNPKSVFAAGW